jgi:hypothetical protein
MAKNKGEVIHTSNWTCEDGTKLTLVVKFNHSKVDYLAHHARKAQRRGRKSCTIGGGAISLQAVIRSDLQPAKPEES